MGLGYNCSNWNRTEMWYIDASDTTGGSFADGNLVISHAETVMQVGMMAVSGTADDVVSSLASASATSSFDFTPGADNALVVSSYATASRNSAIAVAGPSGSNLFLDADSSGGGGYNGGSAYWENQANTETTYGPWSPTGREGMVIASFETAIPEPSSAALLGLGALGLAFRRRRSGSSS